MEAALGVLLSVLGIGFLAWSAVMAWRTQHHWHRQLHSLLATAKQRDPILYDQYLSRYDDIFFAEMKMMRLTSSADVARFGVECERLQREAQRAFRRVFFSLLPMLGFGALMTLFAALRR